MSKNVPNSSELDSYILNNMPLWVAKLHADRGDNYYYDLLMKHRNKKKKVTLKLVKSKPEN